MTASVSQSNARKERLKRKVTRGWGWVKVTRVLRTMGERARREVFPGKCESMLHK